MAHGFGGTREHGLERFAQAFAAAGGHFDPYLDQFPLAEAAATGWFREHLLNPGTSRSRAVTHPDLTDLSKSQQDLTMTAIGPTGADLH